MSGQPVEAGALPASGPGFFGKVPAVGDFVRRRLPNSFIEPWDAWVRAALDAGKAELGDAWLDIYLTSPIWRFVLRPGACGPDMVAGVMIPSVDSVGRCFPFVIAEVLRGQGVTCQAVASMGAWYASLEEAAISALSATFEINGYDATIGGLTSAQSGWPADTSSASAMETVSGLVLSMAHATGVGEPALAFTADQLAGHMSGKLGFWWSVAGSQLIDPISLVLIMSPAKTSGPVLFAGRGLARAEAQVSNNETSKAPEGAPA